MRAMAVLLAVMCALGSAGCRRKSAKAKAAAAVANAPRVLAIEGDEPLAIDGLDIYLNDDDNAPEPFHMHGTGFSLAGTLPSSLHVGYEAKYDVLKGQTVNVLPSVEEHQSELGISRVSSGTITFEEVSPPDNGAVTISGQVTLRLSDGRVVNGHFVAKAKTWG
jgi:hypothetical protein